MKTFKKGFSRGLSILLTLLMVLSLTTVGMVSISAADVTLAETGAMMTFVSGDYIYLKNFKPSGYSDCWVTSGGTAYAHLFNSTNNAFSDSEFEFVEGTENAEGAIYRAPVTTPGEYDKLIITRNAEGNGIWDKWAQTGNLELDGTNNCFTNFSADNTTYTGSVYTPAPLGEFWVDLSPEEDESVSDLIYPVQDGTTYTLYLPSNVNLASVPIKHNCTGTFQIGGVDVTSGANFNLSSSKGFSLNGDINGQLDVFKSSSVTTIMTNTGEAMPWGTNQGYPYKDDYSTKGTISVYKPDGTVVLQESTLSKIKGRGNSSWEASHKIIGKYAYNLTLGSKTQLLDESSATKKYSLISYNADEARMRNMVVYELAQQIGLKWSPDYEPVDLYNNGRYMGSYLLTDKVEIGDPLVDILNIDDANEEANQAIFDSENFPDNNRGYSGGSSVDDNSTKGFYKYISGLTEPTLDYSQSGFLLEFEIKERFHEEVSGFISNKGQQIVSKYPEFATQTQIEFIMNKWNAAEALMYDDTATYEELSAVIDVESFARMYLIQELTKNLDGGATSYYVYYDGGRFHAGPVWDYDWTLGQYAKAFSDRANYNESENVFWNHIDANPSTSGGWYMNSKEIEGDQVNGNYTGTGTLNAQAALCQNPAFWSAVKAEWNESFYHQVDLMATASGITDVSELQGTIQTFYNQVKDSTAMDEEVWGLIASDPFVTNNWGSTDTGDTHDAAVVWLNNWIRDRLAWMDGYLGINNSQDKEDFYKVDYDIQPPVVTTDKAEYEAGEAVTLTITDVTGGDYTYTIYRDGTQVANGVAAGTFTDTATGTTTSSYTVVAKSTGSSAKQSAASDPAEITITGFNLAINSITHPETAMVGDTLYIKVNTNITTDTGFSYKLTYGDGQEKLNADGVFNNVTVTPDMISDAYPFTVTVQGIVDGVQQSVTETFTVNITDYDMTLNVKAPASAEIGSVITITAIANASGEVTYELFEVNGETKSLGTNTTGIFTVEVPESALNTTKNYKVVAKTTVSGNEYEKEATASINVTAVSEAYTAVLYFKSADSYGYIPQLTTSGAVNDAETDFMTRHQFICKNITQTASYSWYKSEELTVSKSSGQLAVNIMSTRYNMEGNITLTLSDYVANEDGVIEVYLACTSLNFNSDVLIHDLTDWSEDDRNWTMNAAHMIKNVEEDSNETIVAVAAMLAPRYIGDVNNDGIVNVKDATLLQKNLANLATLDADTKNIADVCYDGTLSVKDATAIQKRVATL